MYCETDPISFPKLVFELSDTYRTSIQTVYFNNRDYLADRQNPTRITVGDTGDPLIDA